MLYNTKWNKQYKYTQICHLPLITQRNAASTEEHCWQIAPESGL